MSKESFNHCHTLQIENSIYKHELNLLR